MPQRWLYKIIGKFKPKCLQSKLFGLNPVAILGEEGHAYPNGNIFYMML